MAIYAQIQERVRSRHGVTVKTCWIAHVKELNGLPLRRAWNRRSVEQRRHPCPERYQPMIEEVMRELGMLK